METDSKQSLGAKSATKAGGVLAKLFRFTMKLFLICLFIAGGFFIGGFFQFSNKVTGYSFSQDVAQTQGIVVLTGGSARIAKSLELMKEKKGERLLISGVNSGTSLTALKAVHSNYDGVFDCCVDIETAALDTIGNAKETRKWMEANGYKTLILVTSAYHLPRSLLEFRRQMPDIELVPYPVKLNSLARKDWWKNSTTLRFMISEYLKYVGAWLRPMFQPRLLNAIRGSLFGT